MTNHRTDLRAIVHASLLLPSPLRHYRPRPGRHAEHEDIGLFAGGVPGPDFNYVQVFGPLDPERVFALAEEFFGASGGYSVAVEVGPAQPTEDALRACGWLMVEEEPALVLPRLPPAPPLPPPGLDIRLVVDEAGFADFMAVAHTPAHFLPTPAVALDPAVALHVGYVDGRAVATSRLVCLETIAEITGVVTVPEYRRRGYGTALTWAAVMEGARRGCTVATLTASEMGYPVYVKMGFVPVCTYRTYQPPAVANNDGRLQTL
jgi:GNAT superfamily N-acetyltransferase